MSTPNRICKCGAFCYGKQCGVCFRKGKSFAKNKNRTSKTKTLLDFYGLDKLRIKIMKQLNREKQYQNQEKEKCVEVKHELPNWLIYNKKR